MPSALLVGGSAATGRAILDLLLARGYTVTVYNRGRHNAGLPETEVIVGDPHFRESIAADLGDRTWDIAVLTYGRVRLLADALRGRVGHLVSISGMPVVSARAGVPLTETAALVAADDGPPGIGGIVPRIIETERRVLEGSPGDDFVGTVVRYPYVYGPHSVVATEWHVIRRVLDGRRRWAVPDGGLQLLGRVASVNAAALIGVVLAHPDLSAGRLYHAADERQLTLRQWISTVAGVLGHEFELVDVPFSLVPPGNSSLPMSAEWLHIASASELDEGTVLQREPTAERARRELGHQDAVGPESWIRTTVEWWLENPPEVDGRAGHLSPADFDYEAEDALLGWWDGVLATRPAVGQSIVRGHSYDHPKAPGAQPTSS